MKRNACLLVFALSLGVAVAAVAGAPALIPVQGVLTDADGNPLSASVDIRFALYDASIGGNQLWSETQTVVVQDGLFTVYLGHVQTLDLSIFRTNDSIWLGMQVGGDPEGPRLFVGSTPFSVYAQYSSYTAGQGVSISPENVISSALASGDGIEITGNVISATLGTSVDSGEITDGSVLRQDLSADGCAAGQVLKSDGSGWNCAADDNPQITCDWSGWQASGNTSCPMYYTCDDYTCLRLYCDGGRVTQATTTTCKDIRDYVPPWCPFFFSFNGHEYVMDTTFIYKLDGPEKEAVQSRELRHLDTTGRVRAKIVELESETSYIDMIRLVVVDRKGRLERKRELRPVHASRDLDELLHSDDLYLRTRQGDQVFLEFEPAPHWEEGWSRRVFVKAEGYYVTHRRGRDGGGVCAGAPQGAPQGDGGGICP